MRVLIVGCGYVGLPLGGELALRGHEVFGLRRGSMADPKIRAAGITPVHADITRPGSLSAIEPRFDWVVNCAAAGGGAAADYRNIYLEGNRTLMSWLAASPIKKFVYTSSTGVYGQNDGSVVTESSPAEPEMETAKILLEAENLLLAGSKGLSPCRQFPAVILRVAGIYGPGRGWWLKQFIAGGSRMEGDGSRWLNMVHRDDLIGIIIAALERGLPGEIYNAADDEPVTQLALYQWLAEKTNRPLPPVDSAHLEPGRRRGVTNKRVSNRKLRTGLGYVFRYPDFRAGFAAELERVAS